MNFKIGDKVKFKDFKKLYNHVDFGFEDRMELSRFEFSSFLIFNIKEFDPADTYELRDIKSGKILDMAFYSDEIKLIKVNQWDE